MGAVETIFSKITEICALAEHMFITQTRKTELCLGHDLGSLRGGLFLKDMAFPQPLAAFTYNATRELC